MIDYIITFNRLGDVTWRLSYNRDGLYIIRNLRSLSIGDLDFRQSNLAVGLLGLADCLRDLCLDHVYNWDTMDLKSIGLHCQQLGTYDSYQILKSSEWMDYYLF